MSAPTPAPQPDGAQVRGGLLAVWRLRGRRGRVLRPDEVRTLSEYLAGGMDRIELRDLRVTCVIGALAHERTAPQPLSIDVDLYVNLREAGATDDLSLTVDYGAVCDRIMALCEGAKPQLLERLAELIASELCGIDAVTNATVTVTKLRPPVSADLGTSAVRITRAAI